MLHLEQEQQFQAILWAQAENQQVLQSLVQPVGTPATAQAAAAKMGLQDNPRAYIKIFE